ncbi:MAG TPA: hypothetical protein VFV67_24620 [Actinophytocola sp.]|uniref:hypothetical protein n=1 Tax=Actinophytocola sp. TaxID=1872138 RepID=UPI002DB7E21F|nr:hypothetical protein [Actinophytocola sp.]HEU5473842.1 hypothetical protein [Actinophytocola sp.]
MIRDEERTNERLRTEDLAGAGEHGRPDGEEEFRPTNDDFRSSDDEFTQRPVDADEFPHRPADEDDPYRGSTGTVDRDTLETEPVRDPADEPEPVDADARTEPETEVVEAEPTDTVDTPDTMDAPETMTEEPPAAAMPSAGGDELPQMFQADQVERFRTEWQQVQINFVDDPREAVQSADHLVAEVMQTLASTFSAHKGELEGQWQQGAEVQTEELRVALRRYRTFFNRLLDI